LEQRRSAQSGPRPEGHRLRAQWKTPQYRCTTCQARTAAPDGQVTGWRTTLIPSIKHGTPSSQEFPASNTPASPGPQAGESFRPQAGGGSQAGESFRRTGIEGDRIHRLTGSPASNLMDVGHRRRHAGRHPRPPAWQARRQAATSSGWDSAAVGSRRAYPQRAWTAAPAVSSLSTLEAFSPARCSRNWIAVTTFAPNAACQTTQKHEIDRKHRRMIIDTPVEP
jgi:hypothetical protein